MKKRTMLPCMKGVLLSAKSLRQLKQDLGDEVILTSRLNSDRVENMFSQIRSIGNDTHPDPVDVIQRINLILLRKNYSSLVPVERPCTAIEQDSHHITQQIADDTEPVELVDDHHPLSTTDIPNFSSGSTANVDKDEADIEPMEVDDDLTELNSSSLVQSFMENLGHDYMTSGSKTDNCSALKRDGLEYIGGWLAKKLIKDFPNLGHRTSDERSCKNTG